MAETSELVERIKALPPDRRADFLRRLRGDQEQSRPWRADRPAGTAAPLTLQQEQLWILSQFSPDRATYNVPAVIDLTGDVDVGALTESLRAVVQRHKSLQTVFRQEGETPVQVVQPNADLTVELTDLTGQPASRADEIARADATAAFDLERGPLVRCRVLVLGPGRHRIVWVSHHIVFDGWSLGVLLRDLDAEYRQRTGQPTAGTRPASDSIEYTDYADWQRKWLDSSDVDKTKQFWRQALRDAVPLELPTDHSYPPETTFDGAEVQRALSADLLDEVERFASARSVSPFMTWLAAYSALLFRHTGQTDLITGCPSSNRHLPEIQNVVGNFVNLLPIRLDMSGDLTFEQLLEQVRQRTLAAYDNQVLPYKLLVEATNPARPPNRLPLVQGSFNYQSVPLPDRLGEHVTMAHRSVHNGDSRFELSVEVGRRPGGGYVSSEYNDRLFDPRTVDRFSERLRTLVTHAIRQPDTPLSRLRVMAQDELALVTGQWPPGPGRAEPETSIPEVFARVATEYADRPAVTGGDLTWTFAELSARANQIANHLCRMRVRTEDKVAICCERSPEMIAAVLGTVIAGAAYVPVDSSTPADRLGSILREGNITAVIGDGGFGARVPRGPWLTVRLDEDADELAQAGDAPPAVRYRPGDMAYIIHTSGSTGQPKGVMVEHRSVTHFARSVAELFELVPQDQYIQFASLSFDVSVHEIFGALLNGITLHLADADDRRSIERLTKLLRDRRISVVDLPPAVLELLDPTEFPDLRVAFIGGEAFSGDLTTRWAADGRRFFNGYGPTEATVTVVAKECTGVWTSSPPIGTAMANHTAYALDPAMRPVPIGVAGELYIGGPGLARGYLNKPGDTARAFVPSPFDEDARLYRTGDLVRWNHDGDLEFLGRLDRQVKVRGLRIEPGEIEEALADHPQVSQAVVEALTDDSGDTKLVAYVVTRVGTPLPPGALRGFLSATLPAYMVANDFVYVSDIPLTSSGKVDTAALPAGVARDSSGTGAAAPATETERRVAEEVFAPLLPGKQVGAGDNFFQLGGSSLQATQVLTRVRKLFGVDIPVGRFFQAPTVSGVAAAIDDGRQSQQGAGGLLAELDAVEGETR